jgi:hypothetical protein
MKADPTQAPAASIRPLWSALRGWNRFWFSPADPTPLGLIRILSGLFTFYVTLAYSVDLQEFFGPNAWIDSRGIAEFRHEFPFSGRASKWDEIPHWEPARTPQELEYQKRWFGVNPNQVPSKGYPVWSIWFHVTDPTGMVVAHVTILAIIFLFTIGFCTRVTSVLTWLGVISYIQRAPTTLFGMDTMMNILLVYLMIGPSGAALSVDRLLVRFWTTRKALRLRRALPSLRPPPLVSANFTLRLLQVHLCIIYLSAGLAKLKGVSWWNGQAPWGTMACPEFSPIHNSLYLSILRFLAENRMLWEITMSSVAVFTLAMEIGFAFLIWHPKLRWVWLTMAVLMHTGIAVFMSLNTFSLMMIGLLLAFVPVATVHQVLQMLGRGAPPLRLDFSGRVPRQVRAASLIRAADAWDQVDMVDTAAAKAPAAEAQPLRLQTPAGEELTGFHLFERLTHSLRLLWPLAPAAWLLGITGLGQMLYPGEREHAPAPAQNGNGKHSSKSAKVAR